MYKFSKASLGIAKIKTIILLFVLIGLGFLGFRVWWPEESAMTQGKKQMIGRDKAVEALAKALPKDFKIKVTPKKTDSIMKAVKKIAIKKEADSRSILIYLSEQGGFGSQRSNDGSNYKLTLYNTRLAENFEAPKLDFTKDSIINKFQSVVSEDDIVLSFNLSPDAVITQLSYQSAVSNVLVIKLKGDEKNIKSTAKMGIKMAPKYDPNEPFVIKAKTKRSMGQLSEDAYRKALTAADQKNMVEAANFAKEALSHRPDHHGARKLLVLSLLSLKQTRKAKSTLNEGLRLSPNNMDLIKIKARVLMDDNMAREALQLLLKITPNIEKDPDYYAFLAAIYQQVGEYQESARLYLHLLKYNPKKGAYMIGLAIASERLGDVKEALKLYNTAVAEGKLDQTLFSYAHSRINHYQ